MQYIHDINQASEYAREAIERLRLEKLPATPDNFELWYVYYSAQHPEVVRALDVLINNRQKITNEHCKEIYHRLLREGRDEEAIRRAGDQINATIRNVTGAVQNVKTATSDYNTRLDDIHAQIGDVEDVKDVAKLKEILSSVMTDTQVMLKQNQKLEEELGKSSHVMKEMQRDLDNVRKEALTDGLTGLSNRKAFDVHIRHTLEEMTSKGQTFSLLMVDIDHFKSFNDNYGHQVGDQVLRLVAKTLTDGVKGRDFAARYGGEEFAIVLPETTLQDAVHVANALRKSVASKEIVNRSSGEKLTRITMSVGAAEYAVGETIAGMIERADAALYTAKHNGRNQVASAPSPSKKKTA